MSAGLPFIDEHHIEVDADRETVWRALTETFGESGGRLFEIYGRVIGVEPDANKGDLALAGSTRIGFLVSEAAPPRRLVLTGRHRFSTYSLAWELTDGRAGRSKLSATTHARFPGIHGRAYKVVVIDSGAHARITGRMLRSVALKATRAKGGRS